MTFRAPPDLVTLFGSETRVRVLAALAGASQPKTAYGVAKVGGVPIPKAYGEVKRLAQGNIVVRRARGWVLADRDIRALLQKRVPVLWWDDWWAEKERMADHRNEVIRRSRSRPLPPTPHGWKPRTPVRRDPRKDQLLREMGLGPSVHG